MKGMSTILGLAVAATLTVGAYASQGNKSNEASEFQAFASEYQNALSQPNYNVEAIMHRVSDRLDLWMPLGIHIKSADEFRSYMKAMGNKIGVANGGIYRIRSAPKSSIRYFKGNNDAFSAGTMEEEVQVAGQTLKTYTSHWLVHLKKQGGAWKVVGGNVDVDPEGRVFTAGDFSSWKAEIEAAMKPTKKGGK